LIQGDAVVCSACLGALCTLRYPRPLLSARTMWLPWLPRPRSHRAHPEDPARKLLSTEPWLPRGEPWQLRGHAEGRQREPQGHALVTSIELRTASGELLLRRRNANELTVRVVGLDTRVHVTGVVELAPAPAKYEHGDEYVAEAWGLSPRIRVPGRVFKQVLRVGHGVDIQGGAREEGPTQSVGYREAEYEEVALGTPGRPVVLHVTSGDPSRS
jgi:hypothetical protein